MPQDIDFGDKEGLALFLEHSGKLGRAQGALSELWAAKLRGPTHCQSPTAGPVAFPHCYFVIPICNNLPKDPTGFF